MSQVTSHILDTARGKPATGVIVSLHYQHSEWEQVAAGISNADGRVADLLGKDLLLPAGVYKLKFEVAPYFEALSIRSFYPVIEIIFNISDSSHYHVPLLLSPFGYSTYRGS